MNNKLAGKNILITAGAQGIGESITKHMIDSGANVAIHYFSSADTASKLKACCGLLTKLCFGFSFIILCCDFV